MEINRNNLLCFGNLERLLILFFPLKRFRLFYLQDILNANYIIFNLFTTKIFFDSSKIIVRLWSIKIPFIEKNTDSDKESIFPNLNLSFQANIPSGMKKRNL